MKNGSIAVLDIPFNRFTMMVASGIINITFLMIGVFGNTCLIYYLMRRKRLKILQLEIVNLAISDLGFVISSCILSLMGTFSNGTRIFPTFSLGCRLSFLPVSACGRTTSFLMVLIALTRYTGIVHNNAFQVVFSRTNTIFMIAIVWSLGFIMPIFAVTDMWGTMMYYNSTGLCVISYQAGQRPVHVSFVALSIIICYFLPFTIMSYCYFRISRTNSQSQHDLLKHSQQSSYTGSSSVTYSSYESRKTDTRFLNASITTICCVYLISYAPVVVYYILELTGVTSARDSLGKNFCVFLISINSFSNPVIFATTYYKRKAASGKKRFVIAGENNIFKREKFCKVNPILPS